MTIVNRPPWQKVDWGRLLWNRKHAYERFEKGMEKALIDPVLRTCAKALLGEEIRSTANNVLELFDVYAKHNWKNLCVKPKVELTALLHAAGVQVFPLEWTWNIHQSWWEPDKEYKRLRTFYSDPGLTF